MTISWFFFKISSLHDFMLAKFTISLKISRFYDFSSKFSRFHDFSSKFHDFKFSRLHLKVSRTISWFLISLKKLLFYDFMNSRVYDFVFLTSWIQMLCGVSFVWILHFLFILSGFAMSNNNKGSITFQKYQAVTWFNLKNFRIEKKSSMNHTKANKSN